MAKPIREMLAVAWKELQLLLREPGALAVLFLLPLLVGSLMSSVNLMAAGSEAGKPAILLDVALANGDSGSFGRETAAALLKIQELQIETLPTAAEAEARVAQGEAAAAVIIPADFTDRINAHTPTAVEVVVDPAQPEAASIVAGIMNQVVAEASVWGEVQYGIRSLVESSGLLAGASPDLQAAVQAQSLGAVMTQLNQLRSSPAIGLQSENLQGVKVEVGWGTYFAYLFPGLTVMFVFFIVGMIAQTLLQEREEGTLRRLLAAPVSRGALLGGKVLAYTFIPFLQALLLFGVASAVYGMPLGRSPAGLLAVTLAVSLAATSLGLMIAGLAKTSKQADSLGTILGFVLAGLGGALAVGRTPLARSGGFIGVVSQFTPHAHAVEGYYRLMAENATLGQIMPQVVALLAMAAVFFGVARWRFRFI